MFLYALLATWISHVLSFNVSISQEFGVNNASCYQPNGNVPCKSISYALGILNDVAFDNETNFIFAIRDRQHDLRAQVQISQPRMDRHIFLTSADESTVSVLHSAANSSGIAIGSAEVDSISTYNIYVSNLEFQQFSASLAAVVIILNSVDVSFT